MKAKKKPLDVKKPSDFGIAASTAKAVISSYKYPPEKPKGQLFQGEAVDVMVAKVVKLLREEAKAL